MLDGTTRNQLRIELAGDAYLGRQRDWTADIFTRISIPLWTPRVNLTLWMPVIEWYGTTPERMRQCRLTNQDTTQTMHGHEWGDVYVTTDFQILLERKWVPAIALRAGIKTASGGGFGKARYYDDPGYFFDASIGKSFLLGKPKVELRLAGSLGFLCWQTDNGRQNDAVMYGLQMMLKYKYLSCRTTWGGYVGWEEHGDRPMSIKVCLSGHIKGFEPYIQYQYGIKDYPFHQLRIGLVYSIDILRNRKSAGTES